MKFSKPYFLIACFTFTISLFFVAIYFFASGKTELVQPIEKVETENVLKSVSIDDTPKEQTELKSLSPYELRNFIDDEPEIEVDKIWEKLGISNKFHGLPIFGKNDDFLTFCNYCKAETFEYNLDDEPDAEVLLRIADNMENCRYLLFKQTNTEKSGWKLLGFADHNFGRYRMPQHSFLVSGGKSFLTVKVQTTSGTGVSAYQDRLFKVENGNLVELLDYPSEGHQSYLAYQGSKEFGGRVSDVKIQNGIAQIEIEFTVKYSGWDYENNSDYFLWSKKQKAIYEKSLPSNSKKFVSAQSDLTQNEIDIIYGIDASDTNTLKYNFENLKQIAQEKGKRNQWLREFLQHSEKSKEKNMLEKIIRK